MTNRRNDRNLSLGEEDERARTLLKTKHSASVMSLGFVASNGTMMPLNWFPSVYRLTAREYETKLADKLVPRIIKTFDISSVTVVLQQVSAPDHASNRVQHFLQKQNFSFWSKNMWPLFSPDAQLTGLRFLQHIEVKACNVLYTSITALRASVNPEWMDYLSKAARLSDDVMGVSLLQISFILNKIK